MFLSIDPFKTQMMLNSKFRELVKKSTKKRFHRRNQGRAICNHKLDNNKS